MASRVDLHRVDLHRVTHSPSSEIRSALALTRGASLPARRLAFFGPTAVKKRKAEQVGQLTRQQPERAYGAVQGRTEDHPHRKPGVNLPPSTRLTETASTRLAAVTLTTKHKATSRSEFRSSLCLPLLDTRSYKALGLRHKTDTRA